MQYLLLIYENEKRFGKGFPEGELMEYRAFGKEFASAIKGVNRRLRWQQKFQARVLDPSKCGRS